MDPCSKCTRSELDTGQGVLGLVAPEDLFVSLLSRLASGLIFCCLVSACIFLPWLLCSCVLLCRMLGLPWAFLGLICCMFFCMVFGSLGPHLGPSGGLLVPPGPLLGPIFCLSQVSFCIAFEWVNYTLPLFCCFCCVACSLWCLLVPLGAPWAPLGPDFLSISGFILYCI